MIIKKMQQEEEVVRKECREPNEIESKQKQ